jgi:hypothetical protein
MAFFDNPMTFPTSILPNVQSAVDGLNCTFTTPYALGDLGHAQFGVYQKCLNFMEFCLGNPYSLTPYHMPLWIYRQWYTVALAMRSGSTLMALKGLQLRRVQIRSR